MSAGSSLGPSFLWSDCQTVQKTDAECQGVRHRGWWWYGAAPVLCYGFNAPPHVVGVIVLEVFLDAWLVFAFAFFNALV